MEAINFAIIIIALLNLFLGYCIFTRGAKNWAAYSLSLFAFIAGIWGVSFYFYAHPVLFSSLIWMKIILVEVFLMISSFFYFSFVFPVKTKFSPLFLVLYWVIAIPLILQIFFTDLWIEDVILKEGTVFSVLGPNYKYFGIFIWIFALWATGNLILRCRKATGILRAQLMYVILGGFLYGIFVSIPDIIIPLATGNTKYFALSPISALFLTGFTAYAITRYRLMDIRLVVRTGLVYFLSIIVLIAGVVGAIYFFSWLVDYTPNVKLTIIGGISMAILLFIFIPLKDFLLKLANKYFFKTVYTSQEALRNLSEKAATIIELDKLIKEIVDTIKKAFGLKSIALLLKEGEVFNIKEIIGFKEDDVLVLTKEKLLLASLERKSKPLISEETEREGKLGNLREKMEEINISLILPLFSKKELTGLVMLGSKVANEAYTKEDLELLETLGSQATIAIENAKLYWKVKDLTENLEQRVKEQTQKIQALLEMKSEFLKIVTHQLNTPASIIKSMLSMMVEGSVKGERLQEFIKKSYLSSERLVTILDDIFAAQSLVAGGEIVKLSPCQIEEIVERKVIHLKPQAEMKNLKLLFEKPKKPLPITLADSEMLERVIFKLIDNAVLYTEKGEIKVSLNLKKKENKDFIEISVKDSGIGLDEEDKNNLFKLFFRGKKATGLHPNGTGLGLFIVKEFVKMHKGEINVKSEGKDKGSTFIITLPIITEV